MSYLDYWCPTCAALPGEVCRSRLGYQADRRHKARQASDFTTPPAAQDDWAQAERKLRKFPTPESVEKARRWAGCRHIRKAADFLDDGCHVKLVEELRTIAAGIGSLDGQEEAQ